MLYVPEEKEIRNRKVSLNKGNSDIQSIPFKTDKL